MELLSTINGAVNDFVWGAPAIILIMGVGLFLTIRLKGIQFRNWGFMLRQTYGRTFGRGKGKKADGGEGEITSFQAAMASVSAVVGSGNIAGVATAIVTGGPGALFWMLVAAAVGMATKYAEIALGVKYREKAADGSYVGGPMYYLAKGLNAKWLGYIVAVLIMFYSVIISAVVDANTMAAALNETFGVSPIIWGVIFAVLTAIVIFGGITRIGEVCGALSPFMAGAYLLCGLLVIVLNITKVPAAIAQIVASAFAPSAALGGAAGITVMTAMRYGMARGIFSNEAGVGSAAITHASAKVNTPAEQAIWGPLEVFVDTFIVCLVSGLTIVLSGLWDSGADGVVLTMNAFQTLLPGNWGQYVVLGASVLFGFSCLITYYNYLEKSCASLFGPKCKLAIKFVWLAFILIGAHSTLGVAWDLADTANGLIIIPNLIGLAILSGQVVKMKDEYYAAELPAYKAEKAAKKAAKKAARS
ncbi:MAG: sodium:alanine symporter family protein [Oscillospiraceae bacterium]|nr:sodium:alanine symporter family protein [Oscillospiraceae bacterium]